MIRTEFWRRSPAAGCADSQGAAVNDSASGGKPEEEVKTSRLHEARIDGGQFVKRRGRPTQAPAAHCRRTSRSL